MRKLTVTRNAMGAYGELGTLSIYVEDRNAENADIVIKGVPCRLLGQLQSGDTKEFEIDEQEVKVFAFMGKTWRNYKYDYRIIEAGCEDVTLTGISIEDKMVGRIFNFDGETPEEVRKDLGKMMLIRIAIVFGAVLIGGIAGALYARLK